MECFAILIGLPKVAYNDMAEMFETGGDDEEVVGWIEEAQEAFRGFKDESWLEWGAKLVMPQVFADREVRLAEEKAMKDREEAEAARIRKEMAEEAEKARRLKTLRERFQGKEIGRDEFVREVRKLDGVEEAPVATQTTMASSASPLFETSHDDASGEPDLDSSSDDEGDDSRLGVRAKRGSKRKSDQDPDELREVDGPVSSFF